MYGRVKFTCVCVYRYAVREGTSRVKIFKNFKEKKAFKPELGAEGIFGGQLLGVTSGNHLSFYDWESLELVRRIEIAVKHVCRYSQLVKPVMMTCLTGLLE